MRNVKRETVEEFLARGGRVTRIDSSFVARVRQEVQEALDSIQTLPERISVRQKYGEFVTPTEFEDFVRDL